jgi:acyl-CoA synthetase (AMP-forming)/AMP-acid ligase II
MDDVIKSRGEKVSAARRSGTPSYALTGVREAAVIGVPDRSSARP